VAVSRETAYFTDMRYLLSYLEMPFGHMRVKTGFVPLTAPLRCSALQRHLNAFFVPKSFLLSADRQRKLSFKTKISNITHTHTHKHISVCLCVCVYIYIYIYILRTTH